MKKIIAFAKLVASRADYLLHHLAGQDIALLFFAILVHFLRWGWALLAADAIAILFLIGKEVWDYFHPKTQSVEKNDIFSGLAGIAIVNTCVIIICI